MRLRATIIIRGAQVQYLYGEDQASLIRRATKLLTTFEPGCGNLWPDRIEISRQTAVISRRKAAWLFILAVPYANIPEAEHEWRKHDERHKQLTPRSK
jgi:hypothetical protein